MARTTKNTELLEHLQKAVSYHPSAPDNAYDRYEPPFQNTFENLLCFHAPLLYQSR